MKVIAIYKIESKVNPNKIYIGSSNDINGRWKSHLSELKRNIHHSKRLQNHYNKYGKEDLIFSIILHCEAFELLQIEQYYIDFYSPYFNICKKAGNCLGVKHSLETRLKMSNSSKGMKHTEETKRKMSEMAMGRKRSPESRLKMSIAKKGIIPWNKGKKGIYSDDYRKKISDSRRGKPTTLGYHWKLSDESKRNISIGHKGLKRKLKKAA